MSLTGYNMCSLVCSVIFHNKHEPFFITQNGGKHVGDFRDFHDGTQPTCRSSTALHSVPETSRSGICSQPLDEVPGRITHSECCPCQTILKTKKIRKAGPRKSRSTMTETLLRVGSCGDKLAVLGGGCRCPWVWLTLLGGLVVRPCLSLSRLVSVGKHSR